MAARVRAVLCLLAVALGMGASAARAADDLPEYRLKAAFLYNFALFTEWPADVGGTLRLCVFGADPFGGELDGLQGKAVGTRSLAVQHKTGIDALKACQIVFIAPSAAGQLARVLEAVDGQAVLTVADSPGAARQGVALNMAVTQNKVSFEANLRAARAAKVNLSSKLLRLATEVIQ
ncbi:MAG: YfiR family protein [Aquincola sp.]|nr:YfiR family protein [Aquincola sp.]MDH5330411.1 YfiR family protein [Aquincola sp.]